MRTLEDIMCDLLQSVLQVVAARKVLRGTVESLIRETREREAAGKANGAGSHANGAGAHSNGASNGTATVATQDAAKVRSPFGKRAKKLVFACCCLASCP